jgi:hypothetical protein
MNDLISYSDIMRYGNMWEQRDDGECNTRESLTDITFILNKF